MFDIEKTFFVWFCLVLSSVPIVKKAKENDIFFIFKNIKITRCLGGTLTRMLKPVRLQVPFDKKGKPGRIRSANLYSPLVTRVSSWFTRNRNC